MSPLQWALLIFAVLAVIAIYLFSRRDRRAFEHHEPDADSPLLPPARARQLDIFGAEGQQFDEFGVGKARRVEPKIDAGPDLPPPVVPAPGPGAPVASSRVAPTVDGPPSQKIVSLLIAEREGTQIHGIELHQALEAQGLQYGARQIYHRLAHGEPVFSVASLLKPGHLDPALAEDFSTPGLTLFMVLPGPVRGSDAIRDMMATADKLARALNAEVFDSKRQSFTPSSARSLQLEVDAWARNNPAS
ncbi:MAG: cell division protein ZipA [Nevskia sp.]